MYSLLLPHDADNRAHFKGRYVELTAQSANSYTYTQRLRNTLHKVWHLLF